jgi:signal transduction histidine kinase
MTAGASPQPAGSSSPGLHAYEAARLHLARMSVAGCATLRAALQEATSLAARTLEVDRVGIWLFVEERRAIRCFDVYERGKDEHSEGALLCAADFPRYFRTLEERREVAADHAREDPATGELRSAYLEPLGIVSMLDAPIFRGGEVVGVVCHEHRSPRTWTPRERAFAGSVADRVAAHLEEAAREAAEARLRTLESQADQARKMEALGRLAAGVAHDFRNVLAVVIALGHELEQERGLSERGRRALREIDKAARRGEAMTAELTSVGREEGLAPRVLDAGELLESLLESLRAAIGKSHSLALRVARPLGRVLIDSSQLERAVLNLVLNARDAMPVGGEIGVASFESRVSDGPGPPGVYVVIEVADTGTGIDEATRARLFEPFFTTKGKDGRGIGLAVVYRAVERAGGFIHVESEPGRGTRMRIYLPRVATEG